MTNLMGAAAFRRALKEAEAAAKGYKAGRLGFHSPPGCPRPIGLVAFFNQAAYSFQFLVEAYIDDG
ncbi:hypothetical protein CQ12_21380 [Bradyrhizobium jicamae]|uniref:Uncharacterized protein n=1 Tax=Bradyrhizobium jicamae TaxID=280332 RepID=A0A0R3LFY3_9BRAD|nr:hypothetical protein CQ12_21380 [Bradyrhizobium jicamae]